LVILWLFNLGISWTVYVLICTVVVLYCFVMCGCVYVWDFVMWRCFGNMYTVLWIRFFLTWQRFFLHWLRFFIPFPQLYGKCQGKTRKDGARSALFHISLNLCCSDVVLFYVLFVCKCVLPPGDNSIAVNKHITYHNLCNFWSWDIYSILRSYLHRINSTEGIAT
jgi:hypothetical protein